MCFVLDSDGKWLFFFFSSRRRHTRSLCDWSSDVCSSDLADPQVGCVSGVYRVIRNRRNNEADQESVYWRYETFIRLSEARLGTMLGAHGSMYAIRREL